MPDNVTLNASTGTFVASTDEVTIGGVLAQVQRVKLVDGTDGGTELIGGTAANGLEVDVTRIQGTVVIQGQQAANVTGSITTAASVVTATGAAGYNMAAVLVAGTYAGVTVTFEVSPDGTNWATVQPQQLDNGSTAVPITLPSNATRGWDIDIGAWSQFRVRATAWTSGTANIWIALQSMPGIVVPSAVLQPGTAGGCTPYSFISTAAVQAASIKASPGQVYGLSFTNTSATIAYVRLYNQTGSPATTDTANIRYRTAIPGNTAGAGLVLPVTQGIEFTTGIGIRVSAAAADNDATALAANVVLGNVFWK
jgi:hypothetical protein